MKFKVIHVEKIKNDIIIQLNSIDEKGEAITEEENSWFIELWRPKVLGLKVKKGDVFEINFKPLEQKVSCDKRTFEKRREKK
jgi:hypothetical protein